MAGEQEEELQEDGSINIFYKTNTSSSGSSITANGGKASRGLHGTAGQATGGGAGGQGTVTKGSILTGEFKAE